MAGIDFIKFAVCGEPVRALMANPKVNASFKIDSNAEIVTKPRAKIGEVEIWFNGHTPETVTKAIVSLCLPKYHQGNNYTNLNQKTQQLALNRLTNEFGIPSNAPLMSFEFGYNLSPRFDVTQFLNHVAYHHGQSFHPTRAKDKNLVRCEHERYVVKLYSKALQHNLPYPLLRYEIGIKKMEHLKALRIFNIADLMDSRKLAQLQKLLLKVASEIVILDFRLWNATLTPKESTLRNQFCRRDTWETIADNRDKIRRTKQRLNLLSSKYYKTTIGQQFAECVAAANHQFWLP